MSKLNKIPPHSGAAVPSRGAVGGPVSDRGNAAHPPGAGPRAVPDPPSPSPAAGAQAHPQQARTPKEAEPPVALPPQLAASLKAAPPPAPPMAQAARPKARHWSLLMSFMVGVVLPVVLTAWYLWGRAADQYASTVAFSVRTEESSSALEILGGITSLSGSSSSDTDILYEYLQSQKLVAEIDAAVDLRALWSKPGGTDPYFAFDPSGTIEDLRDHWARMVKIYYDDGAGLIEVRVLAFEAQDAQHIAEALFVQSSEMINALSAIAREDAIRYARVDLEEAQARLRDAREAVTQFRNTHQMVDPSTDLETQAGLLSTLQQQLANLLIEYDLLTLRTRPDDLRVAQAESRIAVIRNRIAEERRKLGLAGGEGTSDDVYANLFGEYERLVVDREFAEQSYNSAQAAYDAALAEARRQSRYLAAYVQPTLAESARFPQRDVLLGLAAVLILLVWATAVLVLYALKDRR